LLFRQELSARRSKTRKSKRKCLVVSFRGCLSYYLVVNKFYRISKNMAVRIAGVNIPADKRIEVALTYVHGVGRSRANQVLEKLKIDKNTRTEKLPKAKIDKLRDEIEANYTVEGELRRQVMMNVKRLKEVGAYRGMRHSAGLPARGQQTKTNNRTRRGNARQTMGSGRRSVEKK
jgi:small subunit ribosomal protein S13